MKKLVAIILSCAMMMGVVLAGFSDIEGHWAQAEVETLAERGAISGYPDGTIKPNGTITRAEFATLLAKYERLTAINPEWPIFIDSASTWWGGYVESLAARRAIVESDYENNIFAPDTEITRMEIIKMLVRMLGLEYAVAANGQATSFADNDKIAREDLGFANLAVRLKLLSGDENGNANLDICSTRAESFALIARMQVARRIANDYIEG